MSTCERKYRNKFRSENITIFNDVINLKYNEGLNNYPYKNQYPWHLKIIIETRFLFSNARNIEQEEILQNEINKSLSEVIGKYCKIKQVVELEKQCLKELHWFMNSVEIDYLKVKEAIDSIKYKRFIWFYLTYDSKWDNIQTYLNWRY